MTSNQIRYLEAQETARANKAKELENIRSNRAKEAENYRSNVAKESETQRSNLENERRAREQLEYDKYGTKGAGGVVRSIKAGISDLNGVARSLSTNFERVKKNNSATNNETVTERVAGSKPTADVGGLDIQAVKKEIKGKKYPYKVEEILGRRY